MNSIMFSNPLGLHNAVEIGTKNITRRTIKIPNTSEPLVLKIEQPVGNQPICAVLSTMDGIEKFRLYPAYSVGEEIAVAECYRDVVFKHPELEQRIQNYTLYHKYHQCDYRDVAGYSNKMFVSSHLMPTRIKITNIRIEKMQDISDDDCYREGTLDFIETQKVGYPHGCGFVPTFEYATIRDAFADLIDRVSGKGTWMCNPWVWVYEFKLSMLNGNSVFDNQQTIG